MTWHERIRSAQAALDVALRGSLPEPRDSIEIGNLRMLVQRLDKILFEGFFITDRKPIISKCTLTLEDLEI